MISPLPVLPGQRGRWARVPSLRPPHPPSRGTAHDYAPLNWHIKKSARHGRTGGRRIYGGYRGKLRGQGIAAKPPIMTSTCAPLNAFHAAIDDPATQDTDAAPSGSISRRHQVLIDNSCSRRPERQQANMDQCTSDRRFRSTSGESDKNAVSRRDTVCSQCCGPSIVAR